MGQEACTARVSPGAPQTGSCIADRHCNSSVQAGAMFFANVA